MSGCTTVCGSSFYEEVMVEITASEITFTYYLVLILYGVTLMVALLINVTVLAVLLKKFRKFMETTFYVFLFHLLIANMLLIIYQLVIGMPVVFFSTKQGLKDYLSTAVYSVLRHVDVLTEHVTSLITVVIALHRMMIFTSKDLNHTMFTGKGLMIWQVAIWSVGVIFTAFLGYVNCSFAYALILRNEQYLYVCNEAEFTYPIFYTLLSKSVLLPTICLVFYLIIVGKLYIIYKKTGNKYTDVNILSQAMITYVAFQIDLIAAALLPLFVIYSSKDLRQSLEKVFIRTHTSRVVVIATRGSTMTRQTEL